jgi:hypothetical protein
VCCKFAIQDFMQEDRDTWGAILTVSPTGTPTAWYPSVFHRVEKNLRSVPQSPTGIPTVGAITDGLKLVGILQRVEKNLRSVPHSSTDGVHPAAHACQKPSRSALLPTDLSTDRLVWRDVWNFRCEYQIITDGNYRRNLMPPTIINISSVIPSEKVSY